MSFEDKVQKIQMLLTILEAKNLCYALKWSSK